MNTESWKDGSRTASIWRARVDAPVYPAIGAIRVDAVTMADVLGVRSNMGNAARGNQKGRQYVFAVLSWCVAQGFRPDRAFDGLSSVELLSMAENALTTLHEDTFDGLTGLERLRLEPNHHRPHGGINGATPASRL